MFRRAVLSAVAAGVAGLAGCGADGSGERSRTVNPALRGTPTPTPTPTATPTPYGAAANDALATPRAVVVGNRRLDAVAVRVAVREGETPVLDRTVRVPGGGETRIPGVFGAAREYAVRVTAADGRGTETTWDPGDGGAHLGVDVGAAVRAFSLYDPREVAPFVAADPGGLVGVDGGTVPLLVDAPGSARRVTLSADTGGAATTATLDVPAGSRLTVPLAVPSAAVRVRAGVDGGTTATFRWQPLADGSLVLRLDDEPRFLCDLLVRDLRVRNDLEAEATLSVAVAADGRERFARSFTLAGGAATTVPAAVPPAAGYVFDVTVDGETERVDWAVCPPVGPVVVRLAERGVAVTVSPTGPDR